jgi:ribosomal protein S18 acetylase RimI-like enzyme
MNDILLCASGPPLIPKAQCLRILSKKHRFNIWFEWLSSMGIVHRCMRIEPFRESYLDQLPSLRPEEWGDLAPSFAFYLKQPFCHPICVIENEQIVGVGACVIHRTTAWLCHIIVHKDQRNRGIGKQITDDLIVRARKNSSVETLLLLATQLGAPVYRKSGFEVESEYVFYKDGAMTAEIPKGIMRCTDEYFAEVLKLDEKISGEIRTQLLELHRDNCWIKIVHHEVDGFYCPALGRWTDHCAKPGDRTGTDGDERSARDQIHHP